MGDLFLTVALIGFIGIFVGLYLNQRLYKCPKCLHRSDYDHIAEVNEEAPYCPYCGTKTVHVGRKYQAWAYRMGLPSEYRVVTASEEDDEGRDSA